MSPRSVASVQIGDVESQPTTFGATADRPETLAEVLRHAILQRGLPLDRLHARLERHGVPVAVSTLSKWQSGAHVPHGARSFRALQVLERELALTSGTLTDLLDDAPARRGPRPRLRDCHPGCPLRKPGISLVCSSELQIDYIELAVEIDASAAILQIRCRAVVTARRSGKAVLSLAPCHGAPTRDDWRCHADPGTAISSDMLGRAWQIAADHQIGLGQSARFDWTMQPGPSAVGVGRFALCLATPHDEVALKVEGPLGALGVIAEHRSADGTQVERQDLVGDVCAVAVFSSPPAGVVSLEWTTGDGHKVV